LGEPAGPDRPALVTAPIDKKIAQSEGLTHPGHTEYLATRADTRDFAMAMLGPTLRVVLATIHIPLSEVPVQLDGEAIVRAGSLLLRALHENFALPTPRIAVLGLNPHAGEGGVLGHEDLAIIAPAVQELTRAFPQALIAGPLPADTAFPLHARGHFDGVVAMYHDQGLGPFKLLHFDDGVNMTLGLPFVRTSPDHGTAKDIARSGKVNPSSMFAAVAMARGSS
jgi:4-hydroxythreonine-4-phosphate dehydrogenase